MRAERRHHDQRLKQRAKFVLVTKWGRKGDITPRDVGRYAAMHCATGRHRWCGCSPRVWKDGPPVRDLRRMQED